jgi:hypothetical protein
MIRRGPLHPSTMKFTRALALGSICISVVLAAPVSDFDANFSKGLRLIQTSEDTAPFWVTEDQKIELLKEKKYFVSARAQVAQHMLTLG